MTATYLVHKAVGDKLIGVFIDDRFRREGEPKFIVRTLKSLGITLKQLIQRKSFSRLFRENRCRRDLFSQTQIKRKRKLIWREKRQAREILINQERMNNKCYFLAMQFAE